MTDAGSTSSDRILIADDNQQNRELLEAYLADEDHEILMATDGVETIDMAVAEQPDLILLDIMMPKLSGYEVCQQLKQDERTRDIPVLMVTALKEMGDIERAVSAGADEFPHQAGPPHRTEDAGPVAAACPAPDERAGSAAGLSRRSRTATCVPPVRNAIDSVARPPALPTYVRDAISRLPLRPQFPGRSWTILS